VARSAVSDEEIQLRKRARRRLVGAIALVVLVVAAAPMILDGEPPPQQQQHIDVQIAPQRKLPPDERMPTPSPASQANLAEPPAASPDTAAASPDTAVASPDTAPAPPGSAAAPAASASLRHGAAPGKAQEPDAARAGGEAYAVALIATASPAKAAQMKRTLQRLKFPVYTQ